MWTRFSRRLMFGLILLAGLLTSAIADDFLEPEQAFAFSARSIDQQTVRLHWDIAPGYHLYRERLQVQSASKDIQWAPLALPPGKDSFDPSFNKTMVIYEGALDVDLRLTKVAASTPLTVEWQGCADAGLCYPPANASLDLASLGIAGAGGKTGPAGSAAPAASVASTSAPLSKQTAQAAPVQDSIASTLASGSLLRTIGMFWLAGLLLSFTPCVLPMVPILSSLIAGQSGPVSRGKGFTLALAYSLGMALVYAAFGVAAGLAGEGLAASLQNPWVLGAFALLLTVLALSMFGLYELQMPSAIQSLASGWSNKFQGGSLVGVFLMGGVSALVVGPCVAAPLAGALVYIAQTHDVVLGGSALFAMALGMGVPLLLVGLSAGSLLPRAGGWMERVKQVFGMMLLGVAIWMVSPVVPAAAHMLLWATWLLAAAALLGLFGATAQQKASPPVAARATGAALSALAMVLLVGAASGGQSVLQPLAHLRPVAGGTGTAAIADAAHAGLQFERVANVQALDAVLAQAQQQGQPVMLDFYADWCVSCKEFENFTFSDPEVRKRLSKVRLLQADVTDNNADQKALLKRFSLFGPPAILFFDGASGARVTHKVIGYQPPKDFLASLAAAAIR